MTLAQQFVALFKGIPVRLEARLKALDARLQCDGEQRRALKAGRGREHQA